MIAYEDGFGALLDALEDEIYYSSTVDLADRIWDRLEDQGYVIVKTNEKKLLSADVREIRTKYKTGASQVDLAHMYRVNPATISRIVRGLYW